MCGCVYASQCMCVCVRVYVYMCMCSSVCMCMCVCVYDSGCVCMGVRVGVCMHLSMSPCLSISPSLLVVVSWCRWIVVLLADDMRVEATHSALLLLLLGCNNLIQHAELFATITTTTTVITQIYNFKS